jgi:manganese/zinc/iron transport system permease protein
MAYSNPYSGNSFFEFFITLFTRLWGLISGQISLANLASDEIQMAVLIGVSLSAASLGCFLVLRRMTMLANALSHTILLGIVVAYFFSTHSSASYDDHLSHPLISIEMMLMASLAMGLVTTFLTEFLTKHAGLQEDASIGIVFTSLFALGVILVTLLTRSAHIGTEVIMGNVDALSFGDLKLVAAVLAMNFLLLFLFYKEYLITTFDSGLSSALGISTIFFNYLLMIQVSATAIGGFRAVGVLMVLAFMTGPPLTARLLTHNLKHMLIWSGILGCIASIIGVALSRHFLSVTGTALSTGGLVVCVIGTLFAIVICWKEMGCRLRCRCR